MIKMTGRYIIAFVLFGVAWPACTEEGLSMDTLAHPMTISLSMTPEYAPGKKSTWNLSVNSSGKACLIIYAKPRLVREFELGEEKLNRLRNLIASENFYGLKPYFGHAYVDPHQSTTILTIVHNYKTHTVTVGNDLQGIDDKQLVNIAKVILEIRGVFSDEQALDTSDVLRKILATSSK